MLQLKIQKCHKNAILPKFAHPGDAGLDLFAVEKYQLLPGQVQLIRTGLKMELPKNTEAQIRSRSGLALSCQVVVLNSPGTIDEGYRGEIGVILMNFGKRTFIVKKGMRIAQMVIKRTLPVKIKEMHRFTASSRSGKGFGSTGIYDK